MSARSGMLALASAAVLGLAGCGSFRNQEPLSGVEENRDALVLDGPGRAQEPAAAEPQEQQGFGARLLPWNWFK